ncbi:MAG TPA: proprotein convertase P-domain-containing protein, partial [Thermoanaerobaculia bacterium]
HNVRESGPLGGAAAQITDFQGPFIAPVDASSSLMFDRSESGFEDVNAYFHIDKAQTYLQSLGFVGPRSIAPYAIETDTHAAGGADDSFFIASAIEAGVGRLHFGEGGTDDAEDSDLIVHEYAHAIHEWISPGTFLGSFGDEARAISEGFGDYWAFSAKYPAALASGRDPYCIADWDARCWTDPSSERCAYPAGSDCLRRTDSTKTTADYVRSDSSGVEHRNGEIWSAALAEVFVAFIQRYGVAAGKRAADMVVVESLFGTPPRAGFATVARQMLVADQYLFAGENNSIICAAMTGRGILSDCVAAPRGEYTMFPGSGSGTIVPDNDPNGATLSVTISDPRTIERVTVSVDIRHRGRGELRVSLIAPDGTVVRLHEPGPERAPDLITTFGRDSLPVDSLDVFRGRSAMGEWRLRVVDVAFADVATVISWSLNIQFAGSTAAQARPTSTGIRHVVPVVGNTPGANGTFYSTDLRIFNRNQRDVQTTLLFTPSGADGRVTFAAATIVIPAQRVVAFDAVVRTLFASGGLGQLEIIGDVVASTRTNTPADEGSFGFFGPAINVDEAVRSGEVSYLPNLRNSSTFRTNIGFAEVSGSAGRVVVRSGDAVMTIDVAPFSHVQLPWRLRDDALGVVSVEGAAAVVAYSATIDNRSGDPILVPAQRASPGPGTGIVPAISHAGAFGTHWRTEMSFSAAVGSSIFRPFYVTAGSVDERFLAAPFIRFDDIVATLFDRDGTRGTIGVALPYGTFVTTRIWTEGPRGTYGQYVPFRMPTGDPVQDILHIESTEKFRTNIGLMSALGPSTVRVSVMNSDGDVIGVSDHFVGDSQLVQFPVTARVTNGRARVEVISGRVYAYASIVDNATGDAIFVPARCLFAPLP